MANQLRAHGLLLAQFIRAGDWVPSARILARAIEPLSRIDPWETSLRLQPRKPLDLRRAETVVRACDIVSSLNVPNATATWSRRRYAAESLADGRTITSGRAEFDALPGKRAWSRFGERADADQNQPFRQLEQCVLMGARARPSECHQVYD